jgi:hypothetical protein
MLAHESVGTVARGVYAAAQAGLVAVGPGEEKKMCR